MKWTINRNQDKSPHSAACAGCQHQVDAKHTPLGLKDIGEKHFTIALAGNPNTGKSTVFNVLTGMRQHTGNWPGKTVQRAEGAFEYQQDKYKIVDLPGTYSLLSTSEDEQVARNFILFGKVDLTVIVADAVRLERNMNLILQILEITNKAVLCVNLLDEAKRNHVEIDLRALSRRLGIPVVGTSARSKKGIPELLSAMSDVIAGRYKTSSCNLIQPLPEALEEKVEALRARIEQVFPSVPNSRWLAFRLISRDADVRRAILGKNGDYQDEDSNFLNIFSQSQASIAEREELIQQAERLEVEVGADFEDLLSESIYATAGDICDVVIQSKYKHGRSPLDVKIDRIVTSRIWGFPIMLLLLGSVLWLTIIGSNYPSDWLSHLLVGQGYPLLKHVFEYCHAPSWITGLFVDGIYLSTAWVVSVMLPPMAIFFPLFTLLEDFGYLPRVAFNLDNLFRKCGAHGKQSLTMSMGFGCNAAGIVSTRIIDSPRERLIAIITNNFSLCNGRWPTQILIATLFLGAAVPSYLSSTVSLLAVIGIALLGIFFMFIVSWGLSRTILRGTVSTFNLELPPYRPPQLWRTLYTSLIERTLIVLWRAIVFAAPAGAVIWLSCNISICGVSIAEWLIRLLDEPGYLMGLNGVILLAYVFAIPANEIVIPTILMLTMLVFGHVDPSQKGLLIEGNDDFTLQIFHLGGWTMLTAINLMLFSLLHNPCSTTLFTIYKETGSKKWTLISALVPLAIGVMVTMLVTFIWRLFV